MVWRTFGLSTASNVSRLMPVPRRARQSAARQAPFDVLVIGGGPAGAAAAIYAARKGIRTGIAAGTPRRPIARHRRIENFISVKETQGHALAADLEGMSPPTM